MQISKTFLHFQLKSNTLALYNIKSKMLSFIIVQLFFLKVQRIRQTRQNYLEIQYAIKDNVYRYLSMTSLKLTFLDIYYQTQSFCTKKLLRWAFIRSVFVNKNSQYHLQKKNYLRSFKLYFKYNNLLLQYFKLKWKLYLETFCISHYYLKITKN